MRVRIGGVEDALAIAHVQVETWRTAYQDFLPEAYLAGLSAEARAEGWRRRLDEPAPAYWHFVAEDQEQVVAFAAGGPSSPADPAYAGELYAIYVLDTHQRRGIGRALVRAVAEALAQDRRTSMLLWVFEQNAPARRFYESLGGTLLRQKELELGGRADEIGRVRVIEVAYGWSDTSVLRA